MPKPRTSRISETRGDNAKVLGWAVLKGVRVCVRVRVRARVPSINVLF